MTCSSALQRGLHHGDQRVRRNKRLLQHAVRSHPLRFLFIKRIERSNQQNHWDMRQSGIHFHKLADFIAVSHRHEHVGEHQVRPHIRDLSHRRFAVSNSDHVNALIFQCKTDHLLDVAVVVGNQNLRH